MRASPLLLLACAMTLTVAASAQCAAYANVPAGTVILDADDALRTVPLPFQFPFHGAFYDRITVSTNGFLKLGTSVSTSSDLSDTEALMLSAEPRLAVCWDDLNAGPTGSGDVTFVADAFQASVCWQGVQRFGSTMAGTLANCECVLTITGDIYFHYDATCTFNLSNSSSIVGISQGGNVVAAGTSLVDWSLANPGPIAVTQATAYQIFTASTGPSPFDLTGGVTLYFQPTGLDSYSVVQVPALPSCPVVSYPPLAAAPTSIGAGCPSLIPNSSIYEAFTIDTGASPLDTSNLSITFVKIGESYLTIKGPGIDPTYTTGTALVMGDETMVSGQAVGAMGVFPFADLAVTAINISSNGFIRLDGTTGNDFTPTPAEFNTQGARIAGCWKDLNPTSGGAVYFNNTDPTFCMVTWDQVAEYNSLVPPCTFQIKMWANGDVTISHGAVGSTSDAVLVGITRGGATDPGSSDLATAGVVNILGPVDLVGQAPMTHTATTMSLGSTFTMSATVPTPITGLGFFLIGTSNPGLPLDAIGMPGCSQYASLDQLNFTLFLGNPMTTSFPIPYDASFAGVTLFTQAAAFSPLNAFGIVTSNGLQHTVGL